MKGRSAAEQTYLDTLTGEALEAYLHGVMRGQGYAFSPSSVAKLIAPPPPQPQPARRASTPCKRCGTRIPLSGKAGRPRSICDDCKGQLRNAA